MDGSDFWLQFGLLREIINDLITDHWVKALVGLALLLVGRLWGIYKARKDWSRKHFMDRLMVSLNSIEKPEGGEPVLAIRTLLETDLQAVILNKAATARLLKYAARATVSDPVIPIPPADRWYYLNAVLNEISERYSMGHIARDMDMPVTSRTYLICLTNEVAGEVRTRKIRAMVVQKDLLLGGELDKPLALERPNHGTRLDTLARMRERYTTDADLFMEIDLSLPRHE